MTNQSGDGNSCAAFSKESTAEPGSLVRSCCVHQRKTDSSSIVMHFSGWNDDIRLTQSSDLKLLG